MDIASWEMQFKIIEDFKAKHRLILRKLSSFVGSCGSINRAGVLESGPGCNSVFGQDLKPKLEQVPWFSSSPGRVGDLLPQLSHAT